MLRVAIAPVSESPLGDGAAPGWFCASERSRWTQLPASSRCEFMASRRLLRALLRAETGASSGDWDVSAQPGVAPLARASGDAGDAIHASLSHRLGWVAAAISDGPVGVDIECERPSRGDPNERAALMLSPVEFASWEALPADEREPALLTHWTIKEAWFKASPPEVAPWDFRRLVAHACPPAQANVRAWTARPVHVALCCDDANALAAVAGLGLDEAAAHTSFWRVERAAIEN